MRASLTFLGAAKNVTGSRYLLQVGERRVLIDCGMFQERQFSDRNWDPFVVGPETIDAVLLTHAHLDHCGYLPKLVKDGFAGKVYGTSATNEIAKIVLQDCGHLMEEDAAFKKKRHHKEGRKAKHPEMPLYTVEDARVCSPLFTDLSYHVATEVAPGITATLFDSGHILGASLIKIRFDCGGQQRTVLFTGDLGRANKPIIRDPEFVDHADYVLVESTYGNRVHDTTVEVEDRMAEAINRTVQAGGNVIIPSFAIERSQEVLYHLNSLMHRKRIPPLLVFLDSPMAVKVTDVFRQHPELFDEEMKEFMANGQSPFSFPGLQMTSTTEQSKAINQIRGTAIIIAGSGMCTGGRVKHHLVNNIGRPESTILFVGYQAVGTLGRIIVDGAETVRIFGEKRKVRAQITRVHGFSAHADRNEILAWLKELDLKPRKLFITHGEAEAAESMKQFLTEKLQWKCVVPNYKDEAVLNCDE